VHGPSCHGAPGGGGLARPESLQLDRRPPGPHTAPRPSNSARTWARTQKKRITATSHVGNWKIIGPKAMPFCWRSIHPVNCWSGTRFCRAFSDPRLAAEREPDKESTASDLLSCRPYAATRIGSASGPIMRAKRHASQWQACPPFPDPTNGWPFAPTPPKQVGAVFYNEMALPEVVDYAAPIHLWSFRDPCATIATPVRLGRRHMLLVKRSYIRCER